jgi:formamidopyrimidine-DNA glycosylase
VPELPFLIALAENLDARIRGRTIIDARVLSPSVMKTVDPPIAEIRGTRISGVRRRGKVVIIDLASPDPAPSLVLLAHLMRNGRLQLVPGTTDPGRSPGRLPSSRRHERDLALVITLEGGTELRMIERGSKKAASVWLRRAGQEMQGPLAGLGVEPISPQVTDGALARMLAAERMRLKSFLLSQRYLAGIGNAYADEILWEARLSPQALTAGLRPEEITRLRLAVVTVLERAIAAHRAELAGALPMKEPLSSLRVHRHGKEPCPRCGEPIAVIYYEDRETYYCPVCQAGGKIYADRRRSRLLR